MLRSEFLIFLLFVAASTDFCYGYSARRDAQVIAEFRELQKLQEEKNHALIARRIVHQTNWAAVGTISTESKILGFPMVNVIAVDDNTKEGKSNGVLHFLLTDLDFTGKDWRAANKVSFLFSDEQNKECSKKNLDPMEPTCARIVISGGVKELKQTDVNYADALEAFQRRHPAAKIWLRAHTFYLCELNIENIFVLDYYGGPHNVSPEQYYKIVLDD